MKTSSIWCLFPLALVATIAAVSAEGNESIHWRAFKEAQDRSPVEILTDFSYAGYEHGEK
ncbi:MAG: hypothetical protein JHC52_11560, partial [Chthoniobacterales bacterium]|nr:hypothetical protein [Chthoniobacterales bacterium]